jgi:Tfp pilus assembly protein PilX
VVLFIALIVLVAMTLAGIAIVRSVDTGNLVAGNVAFKQGTLTSADRAIDAAFVFLKANAVGTYLDAEHSDAAYNPILPPDPDDWTDEGVWQDAKVVGTDAAGNETAYLIHRMCNDAGPAVDCATIPKTGAGAGNSAHWGAFDPSGSPIVYYRVTARVKGPRGTLSIVQSTVGLQH